MSNTRSRADGHRSLARYRAEAKGDPFVLEVDDSTTITIPRPSGGVLMDVEEAGSSRKIIELLAGDQAAALLEICETEDFSVMQGIAADMMGHFGLGEAVASRG